MPRRVPMPAASGPGDDGLLERHDELEVLDGVVQDGLAGAAAPAARVFAPPDDSAHTGDVSYGILHGLFRLTANIAAGGPLLLAVDDLHWCDRASLRFVAYIAPRLDGMPVVVITGLRSGESPPEASLLDEITNRPGTIAVH